jgi:hypothetical protein
VTVGDILPTRNAESPSPSSRIRLGYDGRPRGCGGIGRRARFRSVWAKARGGSSPLIRIARSGSEARGAHRGAARGEADAPGTCRRDRRGDRTGECVSSKLALDANGRLVAAPRRPGDARSASVNSFAQRHAAKMHSLRHYEVRLRRSGRRPYVVARWTLAMGVLAVLLALAFLIAE